MYFARNRKCAAELRAQERKKPSRIISLLLVISMLCGNFVGLPTVASEVVAYCGLEEHTHSDACYQAVQVAGETTPETLAADAAAETTAPTEAALVLSGGSDAQALDGAYVEKEQCCGKEEHKHSLACFSNPEADLETAAIWEATLPEKLSGDWGKDLAEVAKSQLGYAESAANYLVAEDGETLMGYSRYGAWYSSYTQDAAQAYADWNVPFLFFCLYYAGVEDFPIEENCADWTASLAAAELWRDVAGEYIPEAGDLVFLDTDEDGAADRAAVVTDWDEAKVTAVESDSEGAVKTVTYDLTEDTQVMGYGDTNEAQEKIEVSDGEDAPTLLNNTELTIYFAGWQDWDSYGVNAKVLRGDGNNWQTVAMTKTNDTYTRDGITYNVYSAKVYEIHGGFDQVLFYKGGTNFCYTANNSWVTKDVIEGKIYVPEKGWYSDYSSGSGGGNTENIGTTGSIVNLNLVNQFIPNTNALYVQSTFFDYYSDYEVNGYNRDGHNGTTASNAFPSHDNWVAFRQFNLALSNYYSTNNVKIPLYVGHFQPDWDGFGIPFSQAGLSLYGYKQAGVYGDSNGWQQYFMSVNNSWMDCSNKPSGEKSDCAAQGLVFNELVNGNVASVKNSGTSKVTLPLFDPTFVNSTYNGKKIGEVYTNVAFPFTKVIENGVDYWTYDSAATSLEMKKDNAGHYFLEGSGTKGWSTNVDSATQSKGTYGFFPFNAHSTSCNANTYNYGFGCRLDIPFRLTENGQVKASDGNWKEIVFNFSGDDDVWVFIDGKLVLDIGGAHAKVEGSINFTDKTIWVSGTKSNPGNMSNSQTTTFTLEGGNTSQHTLTMFYMERGMWESNMKITFNFPEENILTVEKDVNTNNVNDLFKGYFANAEFDFNIKNLATHYGTQNSDPSHTGFETPQQNIRDWGSASTGTLQIPYQSQYGGATYTREYANNSTTTGTIGSDGKFTLKNGEAVTFTDQFRRGSYIYLEETFPNITENGQNLYKQLYKTVWTMYEDDVPVSYFRTGNTVTNPSSYDMTSVESYAVDDGRTENIVNNSEQTNNRYTGSRPTNLPTFVFRSYKNPDSTTSTTKLTAKYTNTVRTGTLTLSKAQDGDESLGTEKFKFYIVFTDVGGLDLEGSNSIVKEVELAVGGSTTITGIPVNTTYTIYEKDPTDTTISLSKVTVNGTQVAAADISDMQYGNADAHSITGKISLSGTSGETDTVVFYNTKSAKTSITIKKVWLKADGSAVTDFSTVPESVTVVLWKKSENENGSVKPYTLNPDESKGETWESYTYTFEDLPKFDSKGASYTYCVYEQSNSSTIVKEPGIITLNYGTNSSIQFYVSYGKVEGNAENGFTQTITNKDARISLELTKKWTDSNGNPLTGSALNLIPSSIKVQLQRRVTNQSNAEWEAVTYNGSDVVTINTQNSVTWTYRFENLDRIGKVNYQQVEWEYRVVEYGNTTTIPNGTRVGNFKVSYIVDDYRKVEAATFKSGSNDTLEQTITNKYSPIYITVGKTWAKNTLDKDRSPITVKLQQKVMGSSEDFKDMDGKEATLIAGDNWTVIFTDLPLVTKDGTLYEYNVVEVGENNGHLVHDDILFDVTYVKPNLSTTSESAAATVTNKPHYVTVDIVKKATGTNTLLSGATFLLEKKGTDGNYTTVDTSDPTGSDGKVTFTGLRIGEYRLTETKAPDGYNLLASPITIEVTTNADNSAYVIKVNGEVQDIEPVENVYTYSTTIYNKPKLDMPATGGVGGFEFWILGGLLIMAVPLLMYTFIWYRKGGKYLQR